MQIKQNHLTTLIKASLCGLVALGFLSQAQAADKKADGTYTFTVPGRNGGADRKMTLMLKTEGEKLTGKLSFEGQNGQTRETEITDGKLKGDEVSFTVVREFNGNKITSKYNGKVDEKGIKGKIETERDGNTQSRDWEAKRETDKKEAK
jgi:hypothetical protein